MNVDSAWAKILRPDTSASLRKIAAWGLADYAEIR